MRRNTFVLALILLVSGCSGWSTQAEKDSEWQPDKSVSRPARYASFAKKPKKPTTVHRTKQPQTKRPKNISRPSASDPSESPLPDTDNSEEEASDSEWQPDKSVSRPARNASFAKKPKKPTTMHRTKQPKSTRPKNISRPSASDPSESPLPDTDNSEEEVGLEAGSGVDDPSEDPPTEVIVKDEEDPYLNDSGDDTETVAHCDPTLGCEADASLMITLSLSLMVGAICMLYMFQRLKIQIFPESTATILLGIAVGLVIRMNGKTLSQILYFNPETFFLYLLPPIIFESGYSLNRVNFFKNLVPITVFAVVGTIISTFVIGFGIYAAGFVGLCYQLNFMDCLLWGSLISAIDPVATLAIFNSLDVPPQMYMLVFGESVLNDAVAVVLFRTFVDLRTSEFNSSTLMSACITFFQSLLGSVVLGCVVGLFSALVT
eukprot:TRINITY_DN4909_c0_g1_i1.p1 TRINITY_DN4909_c0_g1~~TRINITY_DN4909_c0_g1_i1.p1  ORF type:complete len:432 (+),score=53.19 TRINITY_DN4909_c0_g1_i1:79-1374(+)